jgi:hypothetical protein
MRSSFAITSIVAAVLAVGMCAAWLAPPHDATKGTAQSATQPSATPPSATPPQTQTQTASERRWQAADTQRDLNAAASADESDARPRRGRPCSRSWLVRNARERRTSTSKWSFVGLRTRRTSGPSIRCAGRPTGRACATRAQALESLVHVEEGEVCGPRWDERKPEVGEQARTTSR